MNKHNLSTLFVGVVLILSAIECNSSWAQNVQLPRLMSDADVLLYLRVENGQVVDHDVYLSDLPGMAFGEAIDRNGAKFGRLIPMSNPLGYWEFEFPRDDGEFYIVARWNENPRE